MNLKTLTDTIREINTEKGWREVKNSFAEYIALAHSELSEALDAWRDQNKRADFMSYDREDGKPMGVGPEMADTLIRVLDMCDVYGIDLEYELTRVLAYSRTRPYKHGGRTL